MRQKNKIPRFHWIFFFLFSLTVNKYLFFLYSIFILRAINTFVLGRFTWIEIIWYFLCTISWCLLKVNSSLLCVIAGVYRTYLHIKHQENIWFKSYCSITVCYTFKQIALMFLYKILKIFNEYWSELSQEKYFIFNSSCTYFPNYRRTEHAHLFWVTIFDRIFLLSKWHVPF